MYQCHGNGVQTPVERMGDEEILRRCFKLWRRRIQLRKEQAESVRVKVEQREKLNNLVKSIKKYKKGLRQRQQENITPPLDCERPKPSNTFERLYKAQKSTIEKLSSKLEAKERLIEQLKLGILDKEALRAVNETKFEIREIFADCSVKTRIKIPPPPEFRERFMISTQKAPKILHEMETRAMERAQRREMILERKRIIEESRKRMIAEALEKKQVQDEEERKRNLEIMKERQRKELELERVKQERKMIFMKKLDKATAFHTNLLLKRGLRCFIRNHRQAKYDHMRSGIHYRMKITKRVFSRWSVFVEEKYQDKNLLADAVFARNILSRVLTTWRELRLDAVRSLQVAEDFYDLLLLNNSFVQWHRYVCVQIMLREKQQKLAAEHYSKRILFHYFYQWRTLPAVIQLEKSKEEKKRKWRQKVWEVLPDYRPPSDD